MTQTTPPPRRQLGSQQPPHPLSHLAIGWTAIVLLASACPTAESKSTPGGNTTLPIVPGRYNPGAPVIDGDLDAFRLLITPHFQITDNGVPVPRANIHVSVTNGTVVPILIRTSDSGVGSTAWTLPTPLTPVETLYACAVDPGYDCVPGQPVVTSNAFIPLRQHGKQP